MYKVIIAAFTRGSLFSGFLIVSSPVTTKETKYLLLITKCTIYYFQNFLEYFTYIIFILTTKLLSTILIPILHCFGREQGPKSQRKYKGSQHLNSAVNIISCWHERITGPSFFRTGRFPWLYRSNRILGNTFKFHLILSKYNQVSLVFPFPKAGVPGQFLLLKVTTSPYQL